ncbi:MAG: transposase [Phycisphaerae bacterium]
MARGASRDRKREASWRRIVREQRRSGVSVREFCRRSQVKESAFYFWRRELQARQAEQEHHRPRQAPQARLKGSPAAPAFVPVKLSHDAAVPPTARIEIELSGGRRVHVLAPVDRQMLAEVLAVLEARPC